MKTILYLSYDGITDPLGQSQILPYLFGLNTNDNYKFIIKLFKILEKIKRINSWKLKIYCEDNKDYKSTNNIKYFKNDLSLKNKIDIMVKSDILIYFHKNGLYQVHVCLDDILMP